jgi:hypothetical protein
MDKKINYILDTWHNRFSDEIYQYSEFEHSDIEYFVGCLLYNKFNFSKALDTMKTIDLSYDFLKNCSNEYDEILQIINSIKFDSEVKSLEFLLSYIDEAKAKYTDYELYLLNRFEYHIKGMAQRYYKDEEVQSVDFIVPQKKSQNPLDRI